MRRSRILPVLSIVAASAARAEPPEPTMPIETPRGAIVTAIADVPASEPPFPALVVAPGSSYPARAPLHAELAAAAAAAGYLVIRFDWAYWSAGGSASADLAAEREDLRAVLASARADPRVDARHIVLAGKSLGSLVAWEVFRNDPGLEAMVLLTPLCVRSGDSGGDVVEERYPGLATSARPVVVAFGRDDPACTASALRASLGEEPAHVTTLVFPGDHGMHVGNEAEDLENVRAVVAAVLGALPQP